MDTVAVSGLVLLCETIGHCGASDKLLGTGRIFGIGKAGIVYQGRHRPARNVDVFVQRAAGFMRRTTHQAPGRASVARTIFSASPGKNGTSPRSGARSIPTNAASQGTPKR